MAGGSQVLGSVNSGVRTVAGTMGAKCFFAGPQIFQDASPFRGVRGGQVSMSIHRARALRSKWLDNADLPLPPRLTHSL